MQALDEFGGPASKEAVRKATDWLIATQHGDGSWGIWGGTAEETSYAIQALPKTGGIGADPAVCRTLRNDA
jgi:hypothetical protein